MPDEGAPRWMGHQLHLMPTIAPAEVASILHATFSTPDGVKALQFLYWKVFLTLPAAGAEIRWQGRQDLLAEIIDKVSEGERERYGRD